MLIVTVAVAVLSPAMYVSYFHRINLQTVLMVAGLYGLITVIVLHTQRYLELLARVNALQAKVDKLERDRIR